MTIIQERCVISEHINVIMMYSHHTTTKKSIENLSIHIKVF